MGLLDKIFGSTPSTEKTKIDWIHLTEIAQLDAIVSSEKLSMIFKHSTRCGTSIIVKRQFQNHFDLDSEKVNMYYLDLITYRDISNEIASRFNVIHESPQLLVIKNGKAVADASHSYVLSMDLGRYL